MRPLPGAIAHPNHEPIPLADRFWLKVAGCWLDGVGESDCWLWLGQSKTGRWRIDPETGLRVKITVAYDYGRVHAPTPEHPKRMLGAHVVAFLLVHGPVPEGMEVAHRCGRGLCCNPNHLLAATHVENMAMARRVAA